MLYALGGCCDGSCALNLSFLLDIHQYQCCRQWTIPFFILHGWWELKLRYCPVKVGLWYTDDLNPCFAHVTNTSRKVNLLFRSFSIVNCIDGRIEFTWSCNVWRSSWWSQRMNVLPMYLSRIDSIRIYTTKAISSKYSNIGDNGSRVWQTPEEGWRTYHLKHEYNKDKDSSLKTLNDKNQAWSQKFRQLRLWEKKMKVKKNCKKLFCYFTKTSFFLIKNQL